MLNGSKTYIGLIVALLPTVAHLFGYEVTAAFSTEFSEVADQLMQLVGLGIAFYGRAAATAPGWIAKQK